MSSQLPFNSEAMLALAPSDTGRGLKFTWWLTGCTHVTQQTENKQSGSKFWNAMVFMALSDNVERSGYLWRGHGKKRFHLRGLFVKSTKLFLSLLLFLAFTMYVQSLTLQDCLQILLLKVESYSLLFLWAFLTALLVWEWFLAQKASYTSVMRTL